MKLDKLTDDLYDKSAGDYSKERAKGNINKQSATGDPDKTELPDRSGNQHAAATSDKRKKKFLGIVEN